MSQKRLPTGPHAITGAMLSRDLSRQSELTSTIFESASDDTRIAKQASLTAQQDHLLRVPSKDASIVDGDNSPFAMSIERLKREFER